MSSEQRIFGVENKKNLGLICIYLCNARSLADSDVYGQGLARKLRAVTKMVLLFAIGTPQILRHQIPYLLSILAVAVQMSDLISFAS